MARASQAWLFGLLASGAIAQAAPRAEPPGASSDGRPAAELYAAASDAFSELRYRDTVGLLERAWHRGDSRPAALRAIFALAGRAAASMGRDAAAQLWFQRWLCLEPGGELPAGASPRLQVVFARARDALGGAALAVHAVRRGGGVELTIRDPLALAASVRADGARTPLAGVRITLATAHDDIELLDTYGNVLSSIAIEPTPPPPSPAPTAPADPPWQDRWSSWAIATAGFALISVTAWWIADDADQRAHDTGDESEEASLKRRRDVATWVSRGALVGTAIAATTGIVVYVRGREHRVVAAPKPGGGSIAWRMRF